MPQWRRFGAGPNRKFRTMSNQAPVLIAEDDPNDVFLLRRAFKKAGLANPLVVVHNGQEAIDYLGGEGTHANRREENFPALLFLDLKMPLMDGFDVLAWLRTRPHTDTLPVSSVTGSNREQDSRQGPE